jgi:hypothetical protein
MLNNCKLTSFLSKNDDDDDEKVCVWVMIKIFLQWFKIRNSSMPGFQVIKMEIRTIWVNSCKFDFYDFVPFWFLIRFSSAFMATISILPSGLKAFLQIFNFRSHNFYIAAMLSEQIEELSFLFFLLSMKKTQFHWNCIVQKTQKLSNDVEWEPRQTTSGLFIVEPATFLVHYDSFNV